MGSWGQQVCAATHRMMTQKALLEEGQAGRLGSAGVCSNTQDNDPEGPARGGPGWKAGVSRCVWLHTGR